MSHKSFKFEAHTIIIRGQIWGEFGEIRHGFLTRRDRRRLFSGLLWSMTIHGSVKFIYGTQTNFFPWASVFIGHVDAKSVSNNLFKQVNCYDIRWWFFFSFKVSMELIIRQSVVFFDFWDEFDINIGFQPFRVYAKLQLNWLCNIRRQHATNNLLGTLLYLCSLLVVLLQESTNVIRSNLDQSRMIDSGGDDAWALVTGSLNKWCDVHEA